MGGVSGEKTVVLLSLSSFLSLSVFSLLFFHVTFFPSFPLFLLFFSSFPFPFPFPLVSHHVSFFPRPATPCLFSSSSLPTDRPTSTDLGSKPELAKVRVHEEHGAPDGAQGQTRGLVVGQGPELELGCLVHALAIVADNDGADQVLGSLRVGAMGAMKEGGARAP